MNDGIMTYWLGTDSTFFAFYAEQSIITVEVNLNT